MKYLKVFLVGLFFVGDVYAEDGSGQGQFELPRLPYELNALEPYISAKTLEFHYSKHHQGYLDNLNRLVNEKKELAGQSLEDIIRMSSTAPGLQEVFNNAAQTWNHTFYWKSMKANGGGQPTGKLLERINKDFGSFDQFKKKFIEVGAKVFGSGWVWLVEDAGSLKVVPTKDGDLPMIKGQKALLTCDVWEHAYYLDYQNRRKDYVEVFLDHLVNWEFAAENFEAKKE